MKSPPHLHRPSLRLTWSTGHAPQDHESAVVISPESSATSVTLDSAVANQRPVLAALVVDGNNHSGLTLVQSPASSTGSSRAADGTPGALSP